MRDITIGTRGSALAMCQARFVKGELEKKHPRQRFDLKSISAEADLKPEQSFEAMSGEGIFVKELETALLERRIDLAVHSLKDLPLDMPPSLKLSAVLKREEAADALVCTSGKVLNELPSGSRVGTSSLRRRSQLLSLRSDLDIQDIRGNVDTRLRKLEEGRYDAIVLAACGLIRLGLGSRITQRLNFSMMLPEPGQGALAVETRSDDSFVNRLVAVLDDSDSRACVSAERAFLRALGGGCRVPIAAYASLEGNRLVLEGAVIASDGHRQVRDGIEGLPSEAVRLGEQLAKELIKQGALELLNTIQDYP